MATGVAPKPGRSKATESEGGSGGTNLYRLTVKQYLRMIEAGVFARDERTELVGGVLIRKTTKYPPHGFWVGQIAVALRALLPSGWIVREEKPIDLDGFSRPEPGIVLARGSREDFRRRDPSAKDVVLVVEVADSTYDDDRGLKWTRHAAAKVPVYVILNIQGRRSEVYRKPWGRGASARYREEQVLDASDEFPVVFEGRELGRIAVKDVLA